MPFQRVNIEMHFLNDCEKRETDILKMQGLFSPPASCSSAVGYQPTPNPSALIDRASSRKRESEAWLMME